MDATDLGSAHVSLAGRAGKRAVEHVLAGVPARMARRRRRGDLIVLSYHNIVPIGERPAGDLSLHLPQSEFGHQLDHLLANYDVVTLESPLRNDAHGRPRVAITFDDAYAGAMIAGVAELTARRVPATVFVSPAFLGGEAFWWDMLASSSGLSVALRNAALTDGRGLTDEVLALARRRHAAVTEPAPCARCATTRVLDTALSTGLISIGSHTVRHPNLTQLDDDELETELRASRNWVRQYTNRSVDAIAYPYGLADDRVRAAASAAGYDLGFMVSGGWTGSGSIAGFGIPRLNIPAGITLDGFAARVAGVRVSQ